MSHYCREDALQSDSISTKLDLMSSELENYWTTIEKRWKNINIYDGPDIYLNTLSSIERPIGLLYAAHFAYSEICNGGFKQHFSNSTGILSPEAEQGFQLIGMHQTAHILMTAMETLGDPFPRERERRQEILKNVALQALRDLDKQFFQQIETENGGFLAASDAFAVKMKESTK
jgi:hypothetical protein